MTSLSSLASSVQTLCQSGLTVSRFLTPGPCSFLIPFTDSASPREAHAVYTSFTWTSALTGPPRQPINIFLSLIGRSHQHPVGWWEVGLFTTAWVLKSWTDLQRHALPLCITNAYIPCMHRCFAQYMFSPPNLRALLITSEARKA